MKRQAKLEHWRAQIIDCHSSGMSVRGISPLIQIAAVHARKIGGVINNDCPLTFEKLVHIKVCLHIDGIA